MLRITPEEFLQYTPQELSGVLFFYQKEKEDKVKSEWERTRIQTYFNVVIQLSKKSKMSYSKFAKDLWPFPWEKPTAATKNPMNTEDWKKFIEKAKQNMESKRKLTDEETRKLFS